MSPLNGQAGTTLTADVSASATLVRTWNWTIEKSVTPSQLDMFVGDSGTVQYTVTVTKSGYTDVATVTGQVCVTNGGAVTTESLTINLDLYTGGPPTYFTSAAVDVSGMPVLAAGASFCYPYTVDVSGLVAGGDAIKVTANVTITNHSGHLEAPFGPSPSANATVMASEVNATINVSDSYAGALGAFSDSGYVTYERTFTCGPDQGAWDNTATILETGQSASVTVPVTCYELQVTKDAATSLTRTWNWTIAKTADQSSLTLSTGQIFLVNYSVTVNATSTDSEWAVTGTITVNNPAPIPATINSVSDVVSDGIPATVTCDVTFPYVLPAGGTLECAYSAALPDASSRTNTATATLQNTPGGTTDFSGTANVSFSEATVNDVDECIAVSDTFGGALGTVCATDQLSKIFTYARNIGPYAVCGSYTVDNTAIFTTNDKGVTGSATWTVSVNVPCQGCSLTIGYWKTHAGFTGNNADMVTPLLPIWLGTPNGVNSVQVTTAEQAVKILSMQGDPSNGLYKLQAQLLAAKLNMANGADGSAISATITYTDAILAQYSLTQWSSLSKANKNKILGYMTTLDNYNNGLIGPGHCSV